MTEKPNEKEPLPVDESLKVIDYDTIYKTNKWWSAVALVNAFGHDKVMVYLWQYKEKKRNQGGQWVGTGVFAWKVQQKMGINFEQNWEDTKKSVDKFMQRKRTVTA
jgi:hypothetical protein